MSYSNRRCKLSLVHQPCLYCRQVIAGSTKIESERNPRSAVRHFLRRWFIAGLAFTAMILPVAQVGKAEAASSEAGSGETLPQVAGLQPYVFPKEAENCIWPQGDLIRDLTGEGIEFFVTDISLSTDGKEVLVTAYPMIDLVLTEEQARYLREGGELTLRRSTDITMLNGEDIDWTDRTQTVGYKIGAETENALYLIQTSHVASDACIWPSEDEAFTSTTDDCADYQLRKVADGYVLRNGTEGVWDGIYIPGKTPVLGSPCLLRMSPDLPIEYSGLTEGITAKDCVGGGCFCAKSDCWMEWSHPVRMSAANGVVSSVFSVESADRTVESPKMLVSGLPMNKQPSEAARRAAWLLTPYARKAEQYYYRPWGDGVELTWFDCLSFPKDGDVQIPRELDGMPVRSIYSKALYGAKGQTLVIPDTVERIAAYAFTALEVSFVEIQNPQAIISENAFYYESENPNSLTIRGYNDSTAEAFANKYQNQFESIGNALERSAPAPAAHGSAGLTLPGATPVPMADFEWLENQTAIRKNSANFVSAGWNSLKKFRTDTKQYAHGVCITMNGSKLETVKEPKLGDVWSEPYTECYVDVPFDKKFFKMTFDVGFDKAYAAKWGAPEKNGYGRLIVKDMESDAVLYDTGIVDNSLHDDWVNLETSDVTVLRIIYQTSPVTEKQKTSLNLLMGQALMYKLGDGYAMTDDYLPALTALPTDYQQYEATAADDVERYILHGYHDLYSRKELIHFTKDEMELVLNGIYALSGKWFQRAELWNYFTTKGWYYPVRIDITGTDKNFYQNANEDTVIAYMKEQGWR